jgi:hypothetical protein
MPPGIELHTQIGGLQAVYTSDGLRVSGKFVLLVPDALINKGYGVLQFSTAIQRQQYALSSDAIAVRHLQSLAVNPDSPQEPPTDSI